MLIFILISFNMFFFLTPVFEKIIFMNLVFLILFMFFLNQHMSIILVQLEILTLMLLFFMAEKMIFLESNFKIIYMIMSLAVIEVAIGLSLIVKFSRYFKKEFLKFFI